jgi:hypothetical protein
MQRINSGGGGVVFSNLSESTPNPLLEKQSSQSKHGKINRVSTPFPHLFGPKCLRFAEVINNTTPARKTRGLKGSMSSSLKSHTQLSEEVGRLVQVEVGGISSLLECEGGEQPVAEQHHDPQGLNLSVCLPFQSGNVSNSGMRMILDEDALNDVDGFIDGRDSPSVMKTEALKLLENQQELGFNFATTEEESISRMVNMEVRDREKMKNDLESNVCQ